MRASSISRRPPPDRGPSLPLAGRGELGQSRDQLAGQTDVRFGARTFEIVDQSREPVAWRFRQPHVPRHDRVEHRSAETGSDVLRNRLRQIVAAVEHGQRNAEDRQFRIEGRADPLDRLEQLAEPFEGKELALERNQQVLRGDQRVDSQQSQ